MSNEVLTQVLGFAVFIFSIIVHENAHGLAAEYFGDPTARSMGRITMNPVPHIDPVGSVLLPLFALVSGVPFIGWAKPVPVDSSNLRNRLTNGAWVAAAGPISNFILALLGAILLIIVGLVFKHNPSLHETGARTFQFFRVLCLSLIQFNCVLAIFNLLPIPPLDGHWILIRFLPQGPREAIASVGRFGFIILLALLWTKALWWIIGPPVNFAITTYQSLVVGVVRFL